MPAYQAVIERHNLLRNMLPEGDPKQCGISVNELLDMIAVHCAGQVYSNDQAGKRKLQRDLQFLVQNEWLSTARGSKQEHLYARVPLEEDLAIDELAFQHLVEGLDVYCSGVSRAHRLEAALRRLQSLENGGLLLTADRFQTIGGGEIVLPAEFRPAVLAALLHGLAADKVVQGVYFNQGQRAMLTLHVQAAIYRGHDLMILAVDDNSRAKGVQAFLLHRFVSATVIGKPAIRRTDFDLHQAIQQGLGLGTQVASHLVTVELLVRGEAADLLRECPLEVHQRYDDSLEEDGDYEARIVATVPPSARLWRWLAGWGADIKVIGPPAVADQLAQRAAAAAASYDEAEFPRYQPRVEPPDTGFISRLRYN